MTNKKNTKINHKCDYLVVGAGTAGMSFIDTILTENSSATIILVDRNDKPGGHWTKAYPFVKLHQTSCNYGVNSEPLGKSLDKNGNEKLDIDDRATGQEIVEYYCKVLNKFHSTGRVQSLFECEYRKEEFESSKPNYTAHSIMKKDGEMLHILCKKLVMIHTKVLVPSMRSAPFPVHESVNYFPVNYLPEAIQSGHFSNYVILGAGKTASDAILELLESGVDQSHITWVISQDVWYVLRDGVFVENFSYLGFKRMLESVLKKTSCKEIFLEWEKKGVFARLDPDASVPSIFKGPTIYSSEILLLRSIKNVVRLGRVTSIGDNGVMNFAGKEDGQCDVHQVPLSSKNSSTVFIDCMAFDFYGYTSFPDTKIYERNKINLGPLLVLFNPSFSSAIIAFLESNIQDDNMKNDCLFYTSKLEKPSYIDFVGEIYLQIKTFMAMGRICPPSIDFILNSRTNLDSPQHNGGMLRFMYFQIGPPGLYRKANKFVKAVEQGKLIDLDFYAKLCERKLPDNKIKLSRADKLKRKKIYNAMRNHTYPSLLTKTTTTEAL